MKMQGQRRRKQSPEHAMRKAWHFDNQQIISGGSSQPGSMTANVAGTRAKNARSVSAHTISSNRAASATDTMDSTATTVFTGNSQNHLRASDDSGSPPCGPQQRAPGHFKKPLPEQEALIAFVLLDTRPRKRPARDILHAFTRSFSARTPFRFRPVS